MSNDVREVTFRLGFESNSEATSSLKKLASEVASVQSQMVKSIESTGRKAVDEAKRVSAATAIRSTSSSSVPVSSRIGGGSDIASVAKAQGEINRITKEANASRLQNLKESEARSTRVVVESYKERSEKVNEAMAGGLSLRLRMAATETRDIAIEIRKSLSDRLDQIKSGITEEEKLGTASSGKNGLGQFDNKRDIELIIDVVNADIATLGSGGGDSEETSTAIGRIAMLSDQMVDHRESTAKEIERIAKEQAKSESAASKSAADAAKQDESDRIAAIRARQAAERESQAIVREQQSQARTVAEAWIHAYEEQATAAERARRDVISGNRLMERSFTFVATGVGRLARGAALLGFASSESTESALKVLAKVQATIDVVRGGYNLLKGVTGVIEGLRKSVLGKVAATQADIAATKVATVGSTAVTRALNIEALSAGRATAAHYLLNSARAGGTGNRKSGAAGKAAGSAASIIPPSVKLQGVKLLVDKLKENSETLKIQTAALKSTDLAQGAVRGVGHAAGSEITKGITSGGIGAMVVRYFDKIKEVAGKAGKSIMRGAARLGSKLGLGVLKTAVQTFIGSITGAGLALAAAGAAAVIGIGVAVKGIYEFGKDLKNGGSEVGGWADSIAVAGISFASSMGFMDGAFDVIGANALAEAEKREVLFDKEEQMKVAHLNRLEMIDLDYAKKGRDIKQDFEDKRLALGLKLSDGPESSNRMLTASIKNLSDKLNTVGRAEAAAIDKLKGQQSTMIGKKSRQVLRGEDTTGIDEEILENQKQLNQLYEKSNEVLEERNGIYSRLQRQVESQIDNVRSIAEEKKRTIDEELQGIEKALMARQREIAQIEEKISTERKGIADIINDRKRANDDAIKSAAQQYAELSRGERNAMDRSLEKARKGGGGSLSKHDIENLQRVSTDENKQFAEQYYERQSHTNGFARSVGRGLLGRRRGLNVNPDAELWDDEQYNERRDKLGDLNDRSKSETAERDRIISEQAKKYGLSEDQVRQNLESSQKSGEKFEIIDRTQININIDQHANAIIERLKQQLEERLANWEREQEDKNKENESHTKRNADEDNKKRIASRKSTQA